MTEELLVSFLTSVLFGSLAGGGIAYIYYKYQLRFRLQYSNIYQKRVLAIEDLYRLFVSMESLTYKASIEDKEWTSQTFSQEYEPMAEAIDRFKDYYLNNRIYFSEELSDLIYQNIIKPYKDIRYKKGLLSLDNTAEDLQEMYQIQDSLRDFREIKMEKIRRLLELKFRNLIGVQ